MRAQASTVKPRRYSIDTAAVLGVAGLVTTLAGSLGASYLAARAQRELRRTDELRATLDSAAAQLATAEASGRQAWRRLLDLDVRSDAQFDDLVRDVRSTFAFPQTEERLSRSS
jgi:multidrug resistance efflux pump